MYDIVIVGSGPAGLTAAIYGLRAGKSVLVIEKNGFGGQIAYSPKVENIPGTIQISGAEFADKLLEQAISLGAYMEMENVTGIEKTAEGFHLTTEDGAAINRHIRHLGLYINYPTILIRLKISRERRECSRSTGITTKCISTHRDSISIHSGWQILHL